MTLPVRMPKPGPILEYHAWLHGKNPLLAEKMLAELRLALRGPGGAMLLEVLEKSIQLSIFDPLGDPRALEARNAQGFILADLQRLASDEHEQILAGQADAASARRALARRASGS